MAFIALVQCMYCLLFCHLLGAAEDEELARRLQQQEDQKRLELQRDEQLARKLQQEYHSIGGTGPRRGYQQTTPTAPTKPPPYEPQTTTEDAELARRLQEEENRRFQAQQGRRTGDDITTRGQALDKNARYGSNSESHSTVLTNETSGGRRESGYNAYYSADNETGYRDYQMDPMDQTAVIASAYATQSGSASTSYSTTHKVDAYGDDEQPRPKTPPPTQKKPKKNTGHGTGSHSHEEQEEEGRVPCQFCGKLFPFENIMLHQVCVVCVSITLSPNNMPMLGLSFI